MRSILMAIVGVCALAAASGEALAQQTYRWEFECRFGVGKKGKNCRAEGVLYQFRSEYPAEADSQATIGNLLIVECRNGFRVEDDNADAVIEEGDLGVKGSEASTTSHALVTMDNFSNQGGTFVSHLNTQVGTDNPVLSHGKCRVTKRQGQ